MMTEVGTGLIVRFGAGAAAGGPPASGQSAA